MQINELMRELQVSQSTDTMGTATKRLGEGIQNTESGWVMSSTGLRDIQMDNPFYSKQSLTEEIARTSVDSADRQVQLTKTQMVLAASTMSGADLKEIEEQGLSAKDLDEQTYTTVADQIKLQLAKAGVDISKMGGLSKDQIAAISGNENYATVMENALKAANLPADDALVQDGAVGMQKIDEMQTLEPEAKAYLVKNQIPVTIENVYQATYAVSGSEESKNGIGSVVGNRTATDASQEISDSLRQQMANIIEKAGFEADENQMQQAVALMDQDIPITEETIRYVNKLQNLQVPEQGLDVLQPMLDAVAEGKRPQEATLIPGESLMDQARTAVAEVQGMEVAPEDVSNYRALEELRLRMTVDASFTLLKSGVEIDTSNLVQLVEDLKTQEDAYAKAMLELAGQTMEQGEDVSATEQSIEWQIDVFKTTTYAINDIKSMPAVMLGKLPDISTATLPMLQKTGDSLKQQFQQAGQRYETMQTQVRKDLGDSIQKAFQNVDDILEDLGLETTDSNARAVRILAYNQMEVSVNQIETMKSGDRLVQNTFRNLTPAVVAQMIKNNENPLNLGLEELNERAEEIQSDLNTSEVKNAISKNAGEERYSKFLWKLDQTEELSEAERTSFIGVFRLIHQVNETDGAAIGMLMQQGQDVTLQNLMTAVRSRKGENQQYTIDDGFGYQTAFHRESLTVTEQINFSFEKRAMETAEQEVTPYKLQQFQSQDTIMQMAPSQLAEALTTMEEPEYIDSSYYEAKAEEIRQAIQAEEQIYQILDRYDIPQTPANLAAMQQMVYDRNSAFRTLTEAARKRKVDSQIGQKDILGEITIEDLMQQSLEEFGEACKTPTDMAVAQEKLADTAENVMRNALLDDGVASIDLKAMQRANSQISIFTEMAKSQTYNIPIMVADQAGNMTLKIVQGVEKKGLVDVAMDMNAIGRLRAAFESDGASVEGTIYTDSNETRELLADQAGLLAQSMQEYTGLSVSLQFAWTNQVSIEDIYENTGNVNLPEDDDKDNSQKQVQTKILYGVARAFIQTVQEVLV